jgi:hypothetical protein
MPAGRPSEYKPEYCALVLECGEQGMSLAEMAKACGVIRETLHEWAKEHPEFSDAFTRARQASLAWWELQARVGLYNRDGVSLNSSLWSRSMAARFPDEYTERRKEEISGKDGLPLVVRWEK